MKKGKKGIRSIDVYIGIDPGKGGGIAILENRFDPDLEPMPATDRDLWELLAATNHDLVSCVAAIELVHSSPQMGVTSAFTFGRGYGRLLMALTAAEIPFIEVRPSVWQKALGIPPRKKKSKGKAGETNSQWKNRLRAKAQQLYPNANVTLKTADALLIATYCKRLEW